MSLEKGMLLHGRYRILEILGEGGMGAVYRAVDENLGVEVAVKENFFTSDEYASQFHREATILASMRHPNLPRVTDHFVIENQGQYLVMDYMEGEDLRERIDRLGTLPEEEVIVLGVAICDALTFMHSRLPTVLHRDIKPGNVKVTPKGEVSLVDFGLAKIVEGDRETTPGARAMTPGYSPPEQYGTARTDPRSDIYSLGATLYEALTGAVPEDGLSRVMEQTALSPIRKRNAEISRRLAAVIEKALAVRPEDRYQTADDFKEALLGTSTGAIRRRLAEGSLTVSPPPGMDGEGEAVSKVRPPSGPGGGNPAGVLPAKGDYGYHPITSPIRRLRRKLGRLFFVVILGVVVGGLMGIYFLFPDLSSRVLLMIAPALNLGPIAGGIQVDTPVVPLPTPTITEVSVFAAVPSPTASATPPATVTQEPEPISTPGGRITLEPKRTITPTPTPTATPLGGGQGTIAFASDRTGQPQIYSIGVDRIDLRRLTDMTAGACQPAWSPDGSQLVFISPCDQNREIYQNSSLFVMNADGSELRPLPTILGGDYDPVWSPDGRFIAFTSLRRDNRPQIYILELETGEVTPLTNDIARDFQPSWSSDGSQLVFVTTRRGPYQIWVTEVGGELEALFSRSGNFKNTNPRWSPNGQVIVFNQEQPDSNIPTLVGVRFENEEYNEFRIFYNWTPSRDAAFSPDGVWLAFESWPDGENHDIYIMTPNGVDLTRLTFDLGFDFDPAWRPMPKGP